MTVSEEIQTPGGTMHYTFGMQAFALVAWNPEPVQLYRDTNYLSQRVHDSIEGWRFDHPSAYDNSNATRAKVTTTERARRLQSRVRQVRKVMRELSTRDSKLFSDDRPDRQGL
eukprot:1118773-Pleurochrysis_carterae.AAC.1